MQSELEGITKDNEKAAEENKQELEELKNETDEEVLKQQIKFVEEFDESIVNLREDLLGLRD